MAAHLDQAPTTIMAALILKVRHIFFSMAYTLIKLKITKQIRKTITLKFTTSYPTSKMLATH